MIVGLWIRLSVDESPVFKEALKRAEERKADAPAERMPLVAVLKHHWRDVLVAMGARMAENISYYVITAFILVYATTSAGVSKQTALNAVLIASALHFAVIPAWGALSDRWGRGPCISSARSAWACGCSRSSRSSTPAASALCCSP